MLSDGAILERLIDGTLKIDGHPGWGRATVNAATAIQPASVDVRLGRSLLVLAPPDWELPDAHPPRERVLDPSVPSDHLLQSVTIPATGWYDLPARGCALGAVYERTTIPDDLAARFEGKSSIGRLFLITHATAGFIDPGFDGHITLELINPTSLPIRLWAGMRIGQVSFQQLTSPAVRPYGTRALGSHYQGQLRYPYPSQAWKSWTAGLPAEEVVFGG